MIVGTVSDEGDPLIELTIAGIAWIALIDTGFNGDLQLPEQCRTKLNSTFVGRETWFLADNQKVEEDTFEVWIPFDGELIRALVTFAAVDYVLIGTDLLRKHRLTIGFLARSVLLERVSIS